MASVNRSVIEGKPQRVALLGRVSTEDQQERQTIQGQVDFLRNFCKPDSLEVAGEYLDDGISGTIPLGDRPAGRRLIDDAKAGLFDEVLVYRLDRLGRSLTALLDAHTTLEACGVTVRSATEPFDTSTSIGRFMFQLLASLAELDRSSLIDRMAMGRDRVARTGRWTDGPIPLGYELDSDRCLTPSTRVVLGSTMTEADLVADLFHQMAHGSTTIAEARRFNLLSVPLTRRYSGGAETLVSKSGVWPVSRINFIIRNPVYKGVHTYKAKSGPIERNVRPLVNAELWQAANDRMSNNRSLTVHGSRVNLLRGLIRCGICGKSFVGTQRGSGSTPGWRGAYYRCSSQLGAVRPDPATRCRSAEVRAEVIEEMVWQDCRSFIEHPEEALAEAQDQLRQRLQQVTGAEGERRRLTGLLRDKDGERERVMTLFRRGRSSLEDVEREFDDIGRETASLRAMIDAIDAQVELAKAWESRVTDSAVLLGRLREGVAKTDATNDVAEKRSTIETLVQQITVFTDGEGHKKTPRFKIRYVFGEPRRAVVSSSGASTVTLARPIDTSTST